MRNKIIKLVLFVVLLVAAGFITNRIVVGIWGVDETVSTTKSPQGTGSTEVVKNKVKDTLVTAYYYDNYAEGVIEYAAIRFFNVNTKECNYLFFPGDTKVSMSDETFEKIYAASTNVKQDMYLNKIAKCFARDDDRYQYTTMALEDAIGVSIDCYETISSDAIISIVNLLDPVSFDVPKNMTFKDDTSTKVHLKKGAQTLTGEQVKGMLTKPELYASEEDRLQCSMDYINEYLTDLVSIADREIFGKYYEQYYSLVQSNTSFNQMRDYLDFLYQIKPSNVVMNKAMGAQKAEAYVLEKDKLQAQVQEFMVQKEEQAQQQEETTQEVQVTEETTEQKEEVTEAAEETTEEKTEQEVTEEEVTEEDTEAEKTEEDTTEAKKKQKEKNSKKLRIEIYNSTTINGLAARWKTYLTDEGYTITATETEKKYHLQDPVIYVSKKGQGKDLLKYFPDAEIKVGTLTKADIRIVLGTNNKKVGK